MTEKSKHFEVVYLESKLTRHDIKDNFINIIYNQLLGYINACINIRNLFVDEYNNNKSQSNFDDLSKQYLSEIKREHYSHYIELEDLKTLRNQYGIQVDSKTQYSFDGYKILSAFKKLESIKNSTHIELIYNENNKNFGFCILKKGEIKIPLNDIYK